MHELASRLEDVFRRDPGVRLAILFGSFARGAPRDDSDVDLAFVGHVRDPLTLRAALCAACGRDVDLVSLSDPGFPLLQAIVRDGRPIFEREHGAYAAWRARAWTTLETDGPWYRRMRDAWLTRVAAGKA